MIRRTAAITAASIAGVVLAGSAAVGANIGILNASDDSGLGTLSAETAAAEPDAGPVSSVGATDESGVRSFTVDTAGTVAVAADEAGLRLVDVRADDGWTWRETAGDPGTLAVTFTSGGDTLVFVASSNADGSIAARVDRPAVTQTPASGVTAPASVDAGGGDDGHEDEGYEHEGRDDDDEGYEHEGRDDDD